MLAQDYGITRQQMDEVALVSHTRASEAQKSGLFQSEIMPIETSIIDEATGQSSSVVADHDDGLRHGTTLEGLAKARPAFPDWGNAVSTGGNSSQVPHFCLYCVKPSLVDVQLRCFSLQMVQPPLC